MPLYYASRGYLKIHEYRKKKFKLIRTEDVTGREKPFSGKLFNGLFAGAYYIHADGKQHVLLDDLPEEFADAYMITSKMDLQKSFSSNLILIGSSLLTRAVNRMYSMPAVKRVSSKIRGVILSVIAIALMEVLILFSFGFLAPDSISIDRNQASLPS